MPTDYESPRSSFILKYSTTIVASRASMPTGYACSCSCPLFWTSGACVSRDPWTVSRGRDRCRRLPVAVAHARGSRLPAPRGLPACRTAPVRAPEVPACLVLIRETGARSAHPTRIPTPAPVHAAPLFDRSRRAHTFLYMYYCCCPCSTALHSSHPFVSLSLSSQLTPNLWSHTPGLV